MKFIYKDEIESNSLYSLPIKSSLDAKNIEASALNQAINLSYLPFAFHHIALLPDVHQGYGMPIGGVLATNKVIVPNAVGKDIGCGVIAIKSNLTTKGLSRDKLKKIRSIIREKIPMGCGKWHNNMQDISSMPSLPPNDSSNILKNQFSKARKQLGTLGSGNHFIEIQKDKNDYIWIMIHSGSRNLGSKVADYYNNIAKKLNKQWYSRIPSIYDLAFLPLSSREAHNYIIGMKYCIDFAINNRLHMLYNIKKIFSKELDIPQRVLFMNDIIDIAHNYAAFENHYGKNVIVHRKGAVVARKGTIGIIPGSQGSKSYITRGLGNPESFMSCSHGAGRCMSRTSAKKNLDLVTEIKKLDDKGILHGIRNIKDLEESSSSYKDIDKVMSSQKDLVEIIEELSPICNIKGD